MHSLNLGGQYPKANFANNGVSAALLPGQSWLGVEESQSDQAMA